MPEPSVQRILVRGVNWLGDAVMTTPALQRLREARLGAHITLLTHAKLADLWQNYLAIDAVEIFSENESAWSIGRRLREKKFDIGLVLPNSPRSALEVWFAGIPQRIGYSRPWRNFFLTQTVAPRPGAVPMHKRSPAEINQLIQKNAPQQRFAPEAHHIFQYLHLTTALGAKPVPLLPSLQITTAEVADARQKFGLDANINWLGINPGAEYGPAKRWPKERFLHVMKEAAAWPNWGVILFGGKNDVPEAGKMEQEFSQMAKQGQSKPKLINLAGRTSLRELMAALKICRVVLTNDSGPMHVAAALGTPVVAPFGSTSPDFTAPGLPGDMRHRLLRTDAPCSPCFLRECPIDFRCMKEISTEVVIKAISETAQDKKPTQ